MKIELQDKIPDLDSEEKKIPSIKDYKRWHYYWAVLRIALGLILLWAFFDKFLGLGFTTCLTETEGIDFICDSAWVKGGSPTTGFLMFATKGPLASFYQALAGQAWIDWLFMMGLLIIGLGLTLGILVRLNGIAGAAMMLLMYSAAFPPEHHPFIDEHIVYAIVFLGIALVHPCKYLGLGRWWSHLSFVKRFTILE